MLIMRMKSRSKIPYYYATDNKTFTGWVRHKDEAATFSTITDIEKVAAEWELDKNDYVIEEK